MIWIILKEWREALGLSFLYLLAVLLFGRLALPAIPAFAAARAEVAALLVLGFVVLAAARPFGGERKAGTLEFLASLPVGRGRLFLGKTVAALAACALGALLIPRLFGVPWSDFSAGRPYSPAATLEQAVGTAGLLTPATFAASLLLLFGATLFATVAGGGEMTAMAFGGLLWMIDAWAMIMIFRTLHLNEILVALLPALGLLVAAAHLFVAGEPFDASRRGRDLLRAAGWGVATVALLASAILFASDPCGEADLPGRLVHATVRPNGEIVNQVCLNQYENGVGRLATRVPWWDPSFGMLGMDQRIAWIDLASREVRLLPDRFIGGAYVSPDRKRVVYCAFDGFRHLPDYGRFRIRLHDGTSGLTRTLAEGAVGSTADSRIDPPAECFWRPDGTRFAVLTLADPEAWLCTVRDGITGRPARAFRMPVEFGLRAVWGAADPDAVAFVTDRWNVDDPASCHAYEPIGTAEIATDPFAGTLRPGETRELYSLDGTRILLVAGSGTGAVLLAHEPGRPGVDRHPLPSGFDRTLVGRNYLLTLRYDPTVGLRGLSQFPRDASKRNSGNVGFDVWRLDFDGSAEVRTMSDRDNYPCLVYDTADRPALLGLKPRRDGDSEMMRWLRIDPATFDLAPANFEVRESSSTVTEWPGWLRGGIVLGDTVYSIERPSDLRTFQLPDQGTCYGQSSVAPLLPCPECGR